jgi:divalent metal cation (Fe/Co/Zn/Cd) transporter
LTYHHSSLIEKIETVRAFHFGTSFLVEVHIVLPATMLVGEAHDIAEGLQQKIERLPEVERVNSRILFIFIYLVHFIGIRPYRS